MAEIPGRRQASVAKTTAAIERAAVALAIEHGYGDLTVDMICEAAGISQRTFFNHFPTKDAAILGRDSPSVDERAARAFIVSDGPLLPEAVGLVRPTGSADPELFARRVQVISQAPVLLAREMERLTGIEGDIREIVALRLQREARDAGDTVDAAELAERAAVVTSILAGVMRYLGMTAMRDGVLPIPAGVPPMPGVATQIPGPLPTGPAVSPALMRVQSVIDELARPRTAR